MEYQEGKISVNVILTKEECTDFSILYLKYKGRNIKKKISILIIGLVVLFLIITVLIQNLYIPASTTEPVIRSEHSLFDNILRFLTPIILVILFVSLKILNPILVKRHVEREYGSNKLLQREMKYVFSSEHIAIESADLSMKFQYRDIYRVLLTQKYIVLFESENLIRIIPKRTFENEERVMEAIHLLEENVPKDKRVTYNI